MAFEHISAIITKDKVNVPVEIIHFFIDNYIIFPLNVGYRMEDVRQEVGAYASSDNLLRNKEFLSTGALEITEIIEKTEIRNYLIHHHVYVSSSYPNENLIHIVVKDGQVVKESILNNTNEEGYLIAEEVLGIDFWDFNFTSFTEAKTRYYGNIFGL